MIQLNKIPKSGNYGQHADYHNDNYNKISLYIESKIDGYIKQKGYFETADSLNAAYPTPSDGEQAYVLDETTGVYKIYEARGGVWTATTMDAPQPTVDLTAYVKKTEIDNWTKEW